MSLVLTEIIMDMFYLIKVQKKGFLCHTFRESPELDSYEKMNTRKRLLSDRFNFIAGPKK